MDQHAFNVRRGRRTRVKACVMLASKLLPAIRVMQVDHNVRGIEQNDQMLREIRDGIDVQLPGAEQNSDRACTEDSQMCSRHTFSAWSTAPAPI